MLQKIQVLITELEDRKSELLKDLESYSDDHLRFQPAPDRWSLLMALQHIVRGEQGIRLTEAELRHNPVRTLQLAVAHFGTHRRQIDRLRSEIEEIEV
jgi:hypothetical protein